ncbi:MULTISPECIES: hypothetical protein [Rhizobium]|uniref:hypothetical protein n=1 Tax=Rhizobium TaxID=379 RepID=UPI0011069919|nr:MULTISPECIES: hypothetical protein [Rhizobium]MBY3597510.1 hypothetical protein [Rhizobium bangladeshense]TLX05567.1 hypothetical protein FFR93_33295 [Rhizobium sp. MHM7A]
MFSEVPYLPGTEPSAHLSGGYSAGVIGMAASVDVVISPVSIDGLTVALSCAAASRPREEGL